MLTANVTAPIIQVGARPSRQLAMKYCPQRCRTMKMKNTCTLQKWRLLKKRPGLERCHHWGPKSARMVPLRMTQTSAAIVTTPKTQTQEPTQNGCRSGRRFSHGNLRSSCRRVAAVQLCPDSSDIWVLMISFPCRPTRVRETEAGAP